MADAVDPLAHIVLITGASRGIGAETAIRLAAPHRHIIVNYREKARRAVEVVTAVQAAGGSASAVQADLTDERAVMAMLDEIRTRLGRLDVLVLNASGGMERDADDGYAMRLNRDAQVLVVTRALPLMSPSGVVVFVTSHLAHFYGSLGVPPEYEPVAASKRAGEDAVRQLCPVFAAAGVRLVVVSGDMIEGTTTVRMLERVNPDAVAARRATAPLPTIGEFAEGIVRAALDPPPDGRTVYVGGRDLLP